MVEWSYTSSPALTALARQIKAHPSIYPGLRSILDQIDALDADLVVHGRDAYGETLLFAAVEARDNLVLAVLLERGADIDLRDPRLRLPEDIADFEPVRKELRIARQARKQKAAYQMSSHIKAQIDKYTNPNAIIESDEDDGQAPSAKKSKTDNGGDSPHYLFDDTGGNNGGRDEWDDIGDWNAPNPNRNSNQTTGWDDIGDWDAPNPNANKNAGSNTSNDRGAPPPPPRGKDSNWNNNNNTTTSTGWDDTGDWNAPSIRNNTTLSTSAGANSWDDIGEWDAPNPNSDRKVSNGWDEAPSAGGDRNNSYSNFDGNKRASEKHRRDNGGTNPSDDWGNNNTRTGDVTGAASSLDTDRQPRPKKLNANFDSSNNLHRHGSWGKPSSGASASSHRDDRHQDRERDRDRDRDNDSMWVDDWSFDKGQSNNDSWGSGSKTKSAGGGSSWDDDWNNYIKPNQRKSTSNSNNKAHDEKDLPHKKGNSMPDNDKNNKHHHKEPVTKSHGQSSLNATTTTKENVSEKHKNDTANSNDRIERPRPPHSPPPRPVASSSGVSRDNDDYDELDSSPDVRKRKIINTATPGLSSKSKGKQPETRPSHSKGYAAEDEREEASRSIKIKGTGKKRARAQPTPSSPKKFSLRRVSKFRDNYKTTNEISPYDQVPPRFSSGLSQRSLPPAKPTYRSASSYKPTTYYRSSIIRSKNPYALEGPYKPYKVVPRIEKPKHVSSSEEEEGEVSSVDEEINAGAMSDLMKMLKSKKSYLISDDTDYMDVNATHSARHLAERMRPVEIRNDADDTNANNVNVKKEAKVENLDLPPSSTASTSTSTLSSSSLSGIGKPQGLFQQDSDDSGDEVASSLVVPSVNGNPDNINNTVKVKFEEDVHNQLSPDSEPLPEFNKNVSLTPAEAEIQATAAAAAATAANKVPRSSSDPTPASSASSSSVLTSSAQEATQASSRREPVTTRSISTSPKLSSVPVLERVQEPPSITPGTAASHVPVSVSAPDSSSSVKAEVKSADWEEPEEGEVREESAMNSSIPNGAVSVLNRRNSELVQSASQAQPTVSDMQLSQTPVPAPAAEENKSSSVTSTSTISTPSVVKPIVATPSDKSAVAPDASSANINSAEGNKTVDPRLARRNGRTAS